ncbi:MAG: hypothetical protein JWM58_1660 [Rhizobium sp.]|nr:hypothetical protein [Rhizobium sp.]
MSANSRRRLDPLGRVILFRMIRARNKWDHCNSHLRITRNNGAGLSFFFHAQGPAHFSQNDDRLARHRRHGWIAGSGPGSDDGAPRKQRATQGVRRAHPRQRVTACVRVRVRGERSSLQGNPAGFKYGCARSATTWKRSAFKFRIIFCFCAPKPCSLTVDIYLCITMIA